MWLRYLVVLALYLMVDAFWFSFSLPSYRAAVQVVQGKPMQVSVLGAIVAYLLLALGLTYFVLPRIGKGDLFQQSLFWGGLYGLVVYGVFDFSNLSIFRDWSLPMSVVDTLWGMTGSTVVTFLASLIIRSFRLP